MSYQLKTTPKFDKQLKKLAKAGQKQIVEYLLQNVNDSENPRAVGKALAGNYKGFWRYRIGAYRVICNIEDDECIVLALTTAHRKDAYR